MFQTIVRNLNLVDSSDWIEQIGETAWAALQAAEASGALVTVDCKAVDSDDTESSYYDITLPCGTEVEALQGVHLEDIEDFVSDEVDILPHGLGVQYMVELEFPFFKEGQEIDHAALELLIKSAVQEKIADLGYKVGGVAYETDYPLPNPEEL